MDSTDPDSLAGAGLPAYAPTEQDTFFVRVEATNGLALPILNARQQQPHDPTWTAEEEEEEAERRRVQLDIIDSFFRFVEGRNDELVAGFIARGLVSPDTTNLRDETPLLAAVRVGNVTMVNTLISLGAIVDGFGQVPGRKCYEAGSGTSAPRTALQLAAELGNLAIVRVLMEKHGADDSLIAPDGALALRLAAVNGHSAIVDYLPARRGGAWLRWRTAHDKEVKKMRRAIRGIARFTTVIVWDIPRHILWIYPKELVVTSWKRRHEIAASMKRSIVELPANLRRAGAKAWRGLKKMPELLKRALQKVITFIKRTPGGIMIVLRWIGTGLKNVGTALANAIKQVASFFHTTFVAIMTWCRSVTLKDAWNGLCHALRAIFVDIPLAIWHFAKRFTSMSYDCLKAVFGILGQCVWYLGAGILWLMCYIPKRIWRLFESMGRSISNGVHEGLVYLDPKRVNR